MAEPESSNPRLSRRRFLGASAAAGGALVVPGWLASRTSAGIRAAQAKKTIRYSAAAEPDSDWIQKKIVPGFTRETGINVETDTTDYVKLHDKQILDLQGSTYDVYQVDQIWVQSYAKSGYLEALDGFLSPKVLKPFYPNLVKIGSVDGKQWTLPLSAIPVDYYYRKDVFKAKGIKPPATWTEVLAAAKETQNDHSFYGFAIRGERGNPITWTWLPMFWSFGGKLFDAQGNPTYNSEEGVASVEFFKKLYKYSPPGWLSAQDVAAALQQNKAAQTTLMSVYNAAMDDPSQSKVVRKIEFAEMPRQKKRATILGMWTIGIGAKSNNKDAAWQFVQYLSRPDIARKLALGGTIGAVQPAIYRDPHGPRYFPVLGKVLSYAQPPPLFAQGEQWFLITGTELQNALSGSKSPKKAMDDATAQVRKLLKQK
jgi:ABC-type glycerol-3-phosphate transport system substrate-binding protein